MSKLKDKKKPKPEPPSDFDDEGDDEDDLVEEITCAYGWCIKSLDYRHILS